MKDFFLLKDLNISGKHILLAGISKTNTLDILRSKAKRGNYDFKVKVIDHNGAQINKYKEKFADLSDHFDFSAADLSDISFIEDEVYDIAVLPSILSSLNMRPLKAIQAMFEVQRVLSSEGLVIIQEKISIEHNNRPEYAFLNWYRSRKNLLYNLYKNKTEPLKSHFYLEDLKFALKALGLNIDETNVLEGELISGDEKQRLFNEMLPADIQEDNDPFFRVISIIRTEFDEMKKKPSNFPPYSIIKCSKKLP